MSGKQKVLEDPVHHAPRPTPFRSWRETPTCSWHRIGMYRKNEASENFLAIIRKTPSKRQCSRRDSKYLTECTIFRGGILISMHRNNGILQKNLSRVHNARFSPLCAFQSRFRPSPKGEMHFRMIFGFPKPWDFQNNKSFHRRGFLYDKNCTEARCCHWERL